MWFFREEPEPPSSNERYSNMKIKNNKMRMGEKKLMLDETQRNNENRLMLKVSEIQR